MTSKGIYIYGIIPNFYGATHFQSLENSGVYTITYNNISAIISNSDKVQLESLNRESLGYLLIHHQKTIETLHLLGFTMIIPFQIGTIVNSKDEVINIMAKGYDLIIETLKKIEYLTELDLVVMWANFPDVLKSIAELEDVKEMKNEILKGNAEITKVDQYKIGLLIQKKINEKNKAIELNILNAISTISLDIKIHEVMNDQMVTNSAILMKRNNTGQFEHVIKKLDKEYDGVLNFKLVGPLPCYSFYTIEVKILNFEQVEQARKELDIKEKTTENEIKKAYLEKAKLFHPDNVQESDDNANFNTIQKAYHTLLDYVAAARQTEKEGHLSLKKETVIENLILVKIKE